MTDKDLNTTDITIYDENKNEVTGLYKAHWQKEASFDKKKAYT
ncbi:hypothetical protein [Bartonella grahamii]|nr:hypothetical protein [Bartonella grahamii]